jgi:hypothetical protein
LVAALAEPIAKTRRQRRQLLGCCRIGYLLPGIDLSTCRVFKRTNVVLITADYSF